MGEHNLAEHGVCDPLTVNIVLLVVHRDDDGQTLRSLRVVGSTL